MEVENALYTAMRFHFLYVDRYMFGAGWVYPENYIPYSMVRYILRGSAEFVINGRTFTVHGGQVVYIPDGCRMECRSLEDAFAFISIRFKAATQLASEDLLKDTYHIHTVNEASGEVLEYFQEVYRNATSQNTGKVFRIRGNLELIIAWLVEHAAAFPEKAREGQRDGEALEYTLQLRRQPKQDPRISVLVDYILNHPTEQFTTETLCRITNLSASTLRRLFKENTGKSPGAFIQDLRLMVAARRLLVTDARISDIAYEVGFEDPNYFSRMFRKNFGVSPQAYRENAQ